MARPLAILGITWCFGMTGLLIGYLIIQAEGPSQVGTSSDQLLVSYGLAPLLGVA